MEDRPREPRTVNRPRCPRHPIRPSRPSRSWPYPSRPDLPPPGDPPTRPLGAASREACSREPGLRARDGRPAGGRRSCRRRRLLSRRAKATPSPRRQTTPPPDRDSRAGGLETSKSSLGPTPEAPWPDPDGPWPDPDGPELRGARPASVCRPSSAGRGSFTHDSIIRLRGGSGREPVLQPESGDIPKISRIVCHEGQIVDQGNRSDHQVGFWNHDAFL
jgi:hypothetical protein